MILIDPSGHGFFKKIFKAIKKAVKGVAKAIKKVAKTVVNTLKNPKALVAIAVGFLAAPFFLAVVPEGSFFWGSVAVGAGGGAVAGATYAAETGQNIGKGALSGAKYGGMMGAGSALLRTGWEYARKVTDKSSLQQWEGLTTEEMAEKGLPGPRYDSTNALMTGGTRLGEGKSLLSRFAMLGEGSPRNRLLSLPYNADSAFGHFVNHVSKVHDLWDMWRYDKGRYVSGGAPFDTIFDVYSFAGMPVAAAYTIPAYYGPGLLTIATPMSAVDTMKNN